MATVKCPLGKRGTPSHEWHDGEKSRIYCLGWEDKRTDEPLEACLNCPDHVNKAQDDLEKWRADHPLVCGFDTSDVPDMTSVGTLVYDKQLAGKKRLIYAEDLFEPVDVNVLMVSKGGRAGGKTMAMYEQLFRQRVEMAPTIDAVEVVRCKDCKNYRPPFCLLNDNKQGWLNHVLPEHFCSYGERGNDG